MEEKRKMKNKALLIIMVLVLLILQISLYTWMICYAFNYPFTLKTVLGFWGITNLISIAANSSKINFSKFE